jgi:hypothetical protein
VLLLFPQKFLLSSSYYWCRYEIQNTMLDVRFSWSWLCLSVVFQVVILCGMVTGRYFRGTYHLHRHGWCVKQTRNKHEGGNKQSLFSISVWITLRPEDGGDMFSETGFLRTSVVITQMTAVFNMSLSQGILYSPAWKPQILHATFLFTSRGKILWINHTKRYDFKSIHLTLHHQ